VQLIEPALSGMLFGLILTVMIGPVFFALIQTSLQEGFRAGSHLAFGVMLSDAACIAFTYFFASQIHLAGTGQVLFGIAGGGVLIGFGLYQGFKKIHVAEIDQPARAIHARYALKGFLMNAANPAVLLFWLSVVGQVKLKEDYNQWHEAAFFIFSLATVFSFDLMKSYAAHRIKRLLKPLLLKRINLAIAVILAGYGTWMIGKSLSWW
jgi:threonine/homoserine/homoserine lactone efflux protein